MLIHVKICFDHWHAFCHSAYDDITHNLKSTAVKINVKDLWLRRQNANQRTVAEKS